MMAVDGLDWALTQTLVDAGRMPCVGQLLAAGASGRMTVTPPTGAASVWTSVATGVMADRHGVCHALVGRADGLTVSVPDRGAVRVPTLWDQASRAGRVTRVAGWPALLPAPTDAGASPDCRRVAAGFDDGSLAYADCWPMMPDAAWPTAARIEAQAAQIHPEEVLEEAVRPLLDGVPAPLQRRCVQPARHLFARWSSVQALGTGWLDATDDLFVALRFDGLPAWMAALHPLVGARLPEALAPGYAWLDMLIGRYMHLLGRSGHVVLVADRGLPAGGYRGSTGLFEGAATGGLLLAGPGVPADSLLRDPRAIDVFPTVLALLGLGAVDSLDGIDLLAPSTGSSGSATSPAAGVPPPQPDFERDDAAVAWLCAQGVAPVDTSSMRSSVLALAIEARLGWTAARAVRGALGEAVDELSALLASRPDHLGVRLALGQQLIAAGRATECVALLADAPAAAREGVWLDTFAALVAYAAEDWATAERHLLQLIQIGKAPFNAPAWLGWVRLALGDAAGALDWLERARAWPGETVRVYEGLGIAYLRLEEAPAAVEAFSRAIAAQPGLGRLHALRAAALEAAGDRSGAQTGRWRALALDPGLPGTLEALARTALDGLKCPAASETDTPRLRE